jgi:DNA/RNA-binding domain of Phe-tRNA-synthetase-like protein
MIQVSEHKLLSVGFFGCEFECYLGDNASPSWLIEMLSLHAKAPLASDDSVRSAIRNLLRHGGFKPTGRSKPASEYLLNAATERGLDSINAAVDACNAVSLHSGLPISVVDRELLQGDPRISIAGKGETYVFNTSGQIIDLEGLLCLFDNEGPCANAVKDAQRTKTNNQTTKTLCIVWGSAELADRTEQSVIWYRDSLDRLGGKLSDYEISNPDCRKH